METINVFYSWQSDLDKATNHFLIRDALRTAIEGLNGNPDTDLVLRLDSDTQNTSGAPDIAQTIFSKIDKCNIFVADISIINPTETQRRKTPNPNVLLELGYAVHRLSWERVICVFNETSGKCPDDLPFDLRIRRITRYKFTGNNSEKVSTQRELAGTLRFAIRQIIESNLALPITSLSDHQRIIRQRDVDTLESILERIDTAVLDYLFTEGRQGKMHQAVIFHAERLEYLASSSTFHIYDRELSQKFMAFYQAWVASIGYGNHFFPTNTPFVYRFEVRGGDDSRAFDQYLRDIDAAETSVKDLVKYVKENYLEIDIPQTNTRAAKAYEEYSKELRDEWEALRHAKRQSKT